MAVGLLLLACGGSSGTGSGQNHAPFTVGYLLPLTGVFAANGANERNGWNLAASEMGSTFNGHQISTTFADTQADPQLALNASRNFVASQNVDLLEGPLNAAEVNAVTNYVAPLGEPTDDLTFCSTLQLTDYQKYKNAISSGWSCDQPSLMLGQYAYNTLHLKHMTVVAFDYAFGWLSAGAFISTFEKAGGTIDKTIFFPSTTVDFSPYVSEIPSGTQGVYVVAGGAPAVRFTQTFSSFGLKSKIPLLGINVLTDYSVLPQEAPANVLGVYTASNYCDGISTAANKRFTAGYMAKYGTYPGYYSEAGYVKYEIAAAVLNKLGSTSPSDHKAVAALLRSVKVTAPRGPVSLSRVTYSPVQNVYVCKVESVDGTLRNVPVQTYPSVQPWGPLSQSQWTSLFEHDSAARPQ
ncbi:MAG TPA: penicillin-binding protein activator [Candidatus Nitrosotalea sp.]|nr:penicillin-binding protein activator [Candidatus Nitrosotalea sp.]